MQQKVDGPTTTFEIPIQDFTTWGSFFAYYIVRENCSADEQGEYDCSVIFARSVVPTLHTETVQLNPDFEQGDSAVVIQTDRETNIAVNADGSRAKLITNSAGRLAGLRLDGIVGPGPAVLATAIDIANALVAQFALQTQQPIFAESIICIRRDEGVRIVRTLGPTQAIELQGNLLPPDHPLKPFFRCYADGLRAASPFYRFLCFFKVTEKLIDVVAPKLRKVCKQHHLGEPVLNGTVPANPFESILPAVVNLSITKVRALMQERYRNVIAHLDLGSPIEPFDSVAETNVSSAAMVMRYCANTLMTIALDSLEELGKNGVALQTSDFLR